MVIFDQKLSKITVFLDDFWSKMTIVSSLKLMKIERRRSICADTVGKLFV